MQTIPSSEVPRVKQLYLEQELSGREIAERLGYSIDAVYYVMRKYHIQRRGSTANNHLQFKKKPASFAIKKKLTPTDTKLLIVGVMLYWAEGYKTSKSKGVDFANSDPAMQKLFIHFLRQICNIDESKIRVLLYSHSHLDVTKQINYWSEVINVPEQQFTKPYINPSRTLEKKSKMPYGLIHIRYHDKKLLTQILRWIEEYKTKLL